MGVERQRRVVHPTPNPSPSSGRGSRHRLVTGARVRASACTTARPSSTRSRSKTRSTMRSAADVGTDVGGELHELGRPRRPRWRRRPRCRAAPRPSPPCSVPSFRCTSTRTMCRNFEPRAVMAASCWTSTFSAKRHAGPVGDDRVAELIDEAIALDQQGGHAERQIELGGGETLGPVFPAHMVHRHLRAVDDDALDVLPVEGVPLPACCGWRRAWCGWSRRRSRTSARCAMFPSARRAPRSAPRAGSGRASARTSSRSRRTRSRTRRRYR